MEVHPSHLTRLSDASTFDEICTLCGATDEVPGDGGGLAYPCPKRKMDHPGPITPTRRTPMPSG